MDDLKMGEIDFDDIELDNELNNLEDLDLEDFDDINLEDNANQVELNTEQAIIQKKMMGILKQMSNYPKMLDQRIIQMVQ